MHRICLRWEAFNRVRAPAPNKPAPLSQASRTSPGGHWAPRHFARGRNFRFYLITLSSRRGPFKIDDGPISRKTSSVNYARAPPQEGFFSKRSLLIERDALSLYYRFPHTR